MLIDLHTHSTASDGQYSPCELAYLVKKKGITNWSLTDHDTVAGLEEAERIAQETYIGFIPGIEISTQDEEEIHILGYGIDYRNYYLKEKCRIFAIERLNRANKICDYLETKGIKVDMDEVKSYAKGDVMGRPHFARYLIAHNIVQERKEAFDLYLDTNEFKAATERKLPTSEEAIDLIHKANGVAFIAHPGLYKMNIDSKRKLVSRLAAYGLDGIECIYSKHSKEETEVYLSWAEKLGLKISVGSDFHGEKVKPDVELGMMINEEKYKGKIFYE